jgi:hypothetical protein
MDVCVGERRVVENGPVLHAKRHDAREPRDGRGVEHAFEA